MEHMRTPILAGASYFATVFAAGFVLGTIRVLLVAPAVGELIAVSLELPFILAWNWIVCGWLLRRYAIPNATTVRLLMGGTAFTLLMAAEFTLSVAMGRPVHAWFAQFQQAAGLLGFLGQVGFAVIPPCCVDANHAALHHACRFRSDPLATWRFRAGPAGPLCGGRSSCGPWAVQSSGALTAS